jgi:hypothetical protein
MDIDLDLRLEGELDLRIAGNIGLDGDGASTRPRIQQRDRADAGRGAAKPITHQITSNPERPLDRAAAETRRAITAAKEALKSEDAEQIRPATERLKQAATRLAEALARGGAAWAAEEDDQDAVDAEFEEVH